MNKFYPPNGELRSSWLSLAEGCRGTSCSPAEHYKFRSENGWKTTSRQSPFL